MQAPEPRVIHRPPCLEFYSEILLNKYKTYNPFRKPLCVKSHFYKIFGDGFSWEISGSRLCDAFFSVFTETYKSPEFLIFPLLYSISYQNTHQFQLTSLW